jgi:hypothetical protein
MIFFQSLFSLPLLLLPHPRLRRFLPLAHKILKSKHSNRLFLHLLAFFIKIINIYYNMKLSCATCTLGFPRMGPNRELKFALEKYWKGILDTASLLQTAKKIETAGWDLQKDAAIDFITVGDYYLYDMVLTWCESLGLCPKRFQHLQPGVDRMFAMARGVDGSEALSKYDK